MLQLKNSLLCASALALGIISAARGAVVVNSETDFAPPGPLAGDPYTAATLSAGPSSTDILHGKAPTASAGNFQLEASRGLEALTDGSIGTFYGTQGGDSNHTSYATGGDGGGSGTSVTYSLGGIYNLSSIVIFGGWNDAGRDAQHYNVLTSNNAGQSFTLLSTVDVNNGVQGTDLTPITNRVEFTEDAAPNLATGVTHIRVDFLAVENGYVGYSEIDVLGSAQFVTGDANRNGVVDINDFIVISDHFYQVPSAPGLDGDIVVDNLVDVKDFRLWKNVAPPAELALVPANFLVPEPSTVALVSVGLFALAALRRRS